MMAAVMLLVLQLMHPTTANDLSPTTDDSLVSCVNSIVQRHFTPDRQIMVSSTGEDEGHLDLLLKNINEATRWSLQVLRPQLKQVATSEEGHGKTGSYVIFIRDSEEVEHLVNQLMDSKSWNHLARFLVVVIGRESTPRQQALSVVQEFWNHARALDVVVLVRLDTVFHLYTWFPYQPNEKCEDFTDVVLINEWNLQNNAMVEDIKNLFVNKALKNFNGCRIRASCPDGSVPEIGYMRKFSNRLNFTLDLHTISETDGSLYDRITSSIMDVVFGLSEMAFGGLPLLIDITKVANPSVSFYEIYYMWYVPCARPLSRLEATSKIFQVSVWISLSATVLLVAVVLWALERRDTGVHAFKNIDMALYNVWAILLGVGVTRMPRTYRLRVIIFAWICYCFSISTVFQTFFTSYLVDPGLGKQIKNTEELLESKMEFGFRSEIKVYFQDSNNWIYKSLLAHGKECSHTSKCLKRIIDTASFATISESWSVESNLQHIKGGSSVCPMNDLDKFPIKIVFYFQKGSIIKEQFNSLLTAMVETGHIKNINAGRTRRGYSVGDDVGEDGSTDQYFVFTTAHLFVAFYTLFLGYILSFLMFLGEMLYNKLKTVRTHRMIKIRHKREDPPSTPS
ncbi:hypothetical protein Cfor_09709 [Coptotermes formosanus]|uniref:Ionotropic glutamate receptor C-terminal domain-containing protein n=1 Tax=Coptotermes formosanus TaxID=36987 RepID=A0A6L2Q1Z8_COPFO|nr:hypothetical protein Cfor_09709 [Coptotermes formosanus]